VDPKTVDQWEVQPFSGLVKDGFVWGRGTLQLKADGGHPAGGELMLRAGYTPERTYYLAFGHDCLPVARWTHAGQPRLEEGNVRLEVALDEGDWITGGYLPGLNGLAALIGVRAWTHPF
jgi:carboxypeptidase PM20D1